MSFTYRMYQQDDVPVLARIWSEHGGWDELNAEDWADRWMRSPVGEAHVALTVERGSREIVGQFIFVPVWLWLGGREVLAARAYAPIVDSKKRGSLVPVIKMYQHAAKALREAGVSLIYMLPDPLWYPLFRRSPFFQVARFPLWSRPLPLEVPFPLPDGYQAGPLAAWDERVDRLWQAVTTHYGSAVVRDAAMLRWKVEMLDFQVTTVERGGDLVGLVASRQRGDRQWLIGDLVARDGEALEATIRAACRVGDEAARSTPPSHPIRKIALLTTPSFQPVVQKLGFHRDDYDFTLVVHALDASIQKEAVDPSKWYVSAND